VRLSKFWELMDGEFGSAYAASLAARHTIHALDDRTVDEALEAGVPPRQVWLALCDDMNVPESRRLGIDPKAAP
jgi:hypothetical protein